MLFVVTFISAIAGLILYDPVLNDADYIASAGADTRVSLGAFCEVILAIANIGTAVVLFPILKRQNEGIALGYVASRVLESTIIVVGAVSLLSVVTLREDFAGAAGADAPLTPHRRQVWSPSTTGRFWSGPASVSASGTGCCSAT